MIRLLIFWLLVFMMTAAFQIDLYSQDVAFSGKINVNIKPKAMVIGPEVYLSELAKIEASDGKTQQNVSLEEIRKINICNAPEPGFSKTIHVEYIKSRVRQQGISLELINWEGTDRTVIETRSTQLSPQEICSHVQNFIVSQWREQYSLEESEEESDIHIKAINEIRPAILPLGRAGVKVEPAYSDLASGIIPIRLTFLVDGQDYEKRTVLFEIKTLKEVITSSKNLDKHEIIQPMALNVSRREVHGFPVIFTKKDELIGKRLKRMIQKGTIITGDMIEVPPLINKGDKVTMVVESPSFRITAQGISKEDGIHGQIIRVANASSMKEIFCQVVDERTVKISLQSISPIDQ